jgi:hypothetical protein
MSAFPARSEAAGQPEGDTKDRPAKRLGSIRGREPTSNRGATRRHIRPRFGCD